MSDSPERPSSQDPAPGPPQPPSDPVPATPPEAPQPEAAAPAEPPAPSPAEPAAILPSEAVASTQPASAPPPPPPPPPPPLSTGEPEGGTNWGQILRWILLLPLWLVILAPLLGKSHEDEVVLYRFNKAIYCWPIIVVGLLGSKLVAWNIATSVSMSWAFNLTVFLVFAAIMFDMPRNRFIVVLLVLGFTTISLWLVQSNTTLTPLTWIKDFFVGMEPQLDVGGARVLSWLLIPLLLFSVFQARVDGKVRITYNEIEFYRFGDVTDSITRFGKRIKLRVSDYLELLPGLGGGSLVIMNDDGNVLEQVDDLVGIVPRWPRINRILETWQTLELQDPAAKIAQT